MAVPVPDYRELCSAQRVKSRGNLASVGGAYKWIWLDELPERNRMQSRLGMAESFRDYLRQRWEAGCRHGRTLFTEIRKLGYVGCYSGLAKLLSPWRQPKAEAGKAIFALSDATQLEVTTPTGSRQLSPQVAAALLSKVSTE
jgi:hypothetical protein